ncbi:MAG: DNA polymerase III subunit beta [Thermoleophilia bacterium]
MKVVAQKADLVQALTTASRAVSSRSSIQVLSGVLLDAREDGAAIAATDMEISIKAPLTGVVERAGAVVLPARIAIDIARNAPLSDVTIEQKPGESQVEIRSGESQFVLQSLPAADFPQLPVLPAEQGFKLKKQGLLETIDRVSSSASRDETRPVLTGVLVHVSKSSVKMVATDSYRLSVKETPLETGVAERVEAIVPARSLVELSRIGQAADAEEVAIVATENQVLFEVGGVVLTSRLIDGQFPNYQQLLPESFEYEVVIGKGELTEVVHRIGLLAQRNSPLRLKFTSGTLTVAAESQDVGRARESLPVRYEGDELEIGFNPEFLEAGVASVSGDAVHMKFISPLRPALLTGENDDFLYLIMPIRLTD